jgi:hypothetical protein
VAADHSIDIVVTSPTGHFDLVVEVKPRGNLDTGSAQLSEYMRRVGADAGLVVGRDIIQILRDTYRGDPSIQVIGEFPTALARGLKIGADVFEFEDSVQQWLEALRDGEDVAAEPLRSALAQYVLPVIVDGFVRAAGPRTRLAAG